MEVPEMDTVNWDPSIATPLEDFKRMKEHLEKSTGYITTPQEFGQGYDAYLNGAARQDSVYPVGSDTWSLWILGWDTARAHAGIAK